MPIIRSLRLYRCSQHVAHNLGHSWLYVWCLAVGYASGLRDVARLIEQHPSTQSQAPDDGHNSARNMLSKS